MLQKLHVKNKNTDYVKKTVILIIMLSVWHNHIIFGIWRTFTDTNTNSNIILILWTSAAVAHLPDGLMVCIL